MSINTKIKNFFKKIFQITNWKRWLLLAITVIGAIVAIIIGSVFLIRKQTRESIEYGGGTRYQVEAKYISKDSDEKLVSGSELQNIANSLEYRFSSFNDFSTSFRAKGDGIIEISRSGKLNPDEIQNFEHSITKKPTLVFTDVEMRPIFTDGLFIENSKIDYDNIDRYAVPLKTNSAITRQGFNGSYYLQGELANNIASIEWAKATKYIAEHDQIMFMWINLDELVNFAKTYDKENWIEAKENAANYSFVSNVPFNPETRKLNTIKKYQFDASKYLITISSVKTPSNDNKFYIQGSAEAKPLTKSKADALSSNINFGSNDKLALSVVKNDKLANITEPILSFKLVWIAGAVILSLIAIVLMVNYGLLGALNTIAMSLFIFLTLLMFTALRGEYSPASFTAIFGSLFLGLTSSITILNKFKSELYKGENVKKSLRSAFSKSFINMFDINVMVLVSSIIFFFTGTQEIKNFSIVFTFSSLFSILIMLFLNSLWILLVIKTGTFDERLNWFGVKTKFIGRDVQLAKLSSFNFVHLSKILMFIPIVLFTAGLITFSSFAGINKDVWAGFSRNGVFNDVSNLNIRIDITQILISLSIFAVVLFIYTLIRFKWTNAVSILVATIINIGLVFSIIVIGRIPFDSNTLITFELVSIFMVIQTYMLFGSLKKKMQSHEIEKAFTKDQIRNISNSTYVSEFKNYSMLLFTNILIFVLLLSFYKSSDFSLTFMALISSILVVYSSLFISLALWSKLEEKRQSGTQKRIDNHYWTIPNVREEQVFSGINSFTP
ncbi:protein translocase subunit SecDF [Mycoplasmopsis felifaucium]|uniref:Protein export membrane protein SecD/SecF C-terminal domain-containing protein n=1 Tax=Mycoplasmopsis felifaucium TaxID=35768 RepID=A0ABZ2RPF5_9BACT